MGDKLLLLLEERTQELLDLVGLEDFFEVDLGEFLLGGLGDEGFEVLLGDAGGLGGDFEVFLWCFL